MLLSSRVEHLAQTDAGLDLYAGLSPRAATSSSSARCCGPFLGEAPLPPCWGRCISWATRGCTARRAWPAPPGPDGICGGSRSWRLSRRRRRCTGLVAFCTLGLYFLRFDYSGIWNASVSSQFNYLSDMLVIRPFLTWGDFTVGRVPGGGPGPGSGPDGGHFPCWRSVCGTLVRSPYLAALVLGLVCFGGLGLISVSGESGLWVGYVIACFQPATVWLCCSAWFTELGLNAVLPWQETIAKRAESAAFGRRRRVGPRLV